MSEIYTLNHAMVSSNGEFILVMKPKSTMTKTEALNMAAYLVSLAEEEDGEFAVMLAAVQAV